jgi:hypothetical protein
MGFKIPAGLERPVVYVIWGEPDTMEQVRTLIYQGGRLRQSAWVTLSHDDEEMIKYVISCAKSAGMDYAFPK